MKVLLLKTFYQIYLEMKSGNITLLIGPCYAGKTTELIRQINRHHVMKKTICLILSKEKDDKKFNFIKSQILYLDLIEEALTNQIFLEADIIAIDDLHFFSDSLKIIPQIADKFNKKVICAGLDNNSNRECYTNVIELIPRCEYVQKLTALDLDLSPAIFSKKDENGEFRAVSRKSFLDVSNTGHLHVITGPMFSGKTTELIRIAKKYQSINKKILAINYSKDTRYDSEANIFSHDKQKFESNLSLDNLETLISNPLIIKSDVIVIDEIQFFKDSFKIIQELIEKLNKIVIVSGLDGDYLQKPFGDICKLAAFSDNFTRLNAICNLSDDYPDASFTRRIVNSDKTEFIGSDDSYVAVSRFMYNLPTEIFLEILGRKKK